MQDYYWLGRFVINWVSANPISTAGAVFALIAIFWLLNRKSRIERENDRVVRNLVDATRGRYDDQRPIR